MIGKRNKERLVFLTSDAVSRLEAWIAVPRGGPGALFPRFRRGGHIALDEGTLPHLTPQAIRFILANRITQAGVAFRIPRLPPYLHRRAARRRREPRDRADARSARFPEHHRAVRPASGPDPPRPPPPPPPLQPPPPWPLDEKPTTPPPP